MKKTLAAFACLFVAVAALPAVEAGLFIGPVNHPSNLALGASFGTGFFVPLMKLEFEIYKISDEPARSMSAALKIRPKLGNLAPYAALGLGAQFSRLSLHFKEDYDGYTFLALGAHLHLVKLLSLRADVRFLHFAAGMNRTRITGGVFLHL